MEQITRQPLPILYGKEHTRVALDLRLAAMRVPPVRDIHGAKDAHNEFSDVQDLWEGSA